MPLAGHYADGPSRQAVLQKFDSLTFSVNFILLCAWVGVQVLKLSCWATGWAPWPELAEAGARAGEGGGPQRPEEAGAARQQAGEEPPAGDAGTEPRRKDAEQETVQEESSGVAAAVETTCETGDFARENSLQHDGVVSGLRRRSSSDRPEASEAESGSPGENAAASAPSPAQQDEQSRTQQADEQLSENTVLLRKNAARVFTVAAFAEVVLNRWMPVFYCFYFLRKALLFVLDGGVMAYGTVVKGADFGTSSAWLRRVQQQASGEDAVASLTALGQRGCAGTQQLAAVGDCWRRSGGSSWRR